MTGTALTEENEFREIYGMDVVVIPTNKPVQRQDLDDAIYMTKNEKFKAVVREIQAAHAKGQPCLVGTITIETSELLSNMLRKVGIPHTVLNAKFHEQEAEIVAAAGQIGAVTIATNMAGRGTDIKLAEGVAELGGLKIIGTERHEARRIDNQLRGRSGRQGDPGESRFYLSLEDDLMRLFGSERMLSIYRALNIPEGEEIQHKTISATIEKAQKKIESNNFSVRRNLLEYDRVNNEQREIMYKERRRVLDGEDMRESILGMMDKVISDAIGQVAGDGLPADQWDMKELNQLLLPKIPMAKVELTEEEKKDNDLQGFTARIQELGREAYAKKEVEFGEHFIPEYFRELERIILLKVIDRKWMSHIDDMDQLRQGVGLQAYGQKDPVVQYKFLGYDMFDELIRGINEDTITGLMHLRIEQHVEREQVAKVTGTNKDDSVAKGPYVRKEAKIGRNDPCPCGSGKKYKQCCGRNA